MNRIEKIQNSRFKIQDFRILFCILHFAFCIVFVEAQSTNQSYPTAITSNEISGKIAARDIGDARLTGYFYTFNGSQGDIFINVQSSNFNGDIDVFTAGNLKPLTKITLYADDTNSETGRVVYLRQAAKLILRVEGRSPNDDPATFKIKFAGSFEAAQVAASENPASEMPEVKSENQSDVRVNSVGTIVEVKPKPQPKENAAKTEEIPRRKKSINSTKNKEVTKENETSVAEEKKTNTEAVEIESSGKSEKPVVEKVDAELKKENPTEVEKKDASKNEGEILSKENKTKTGEAAKSVAPENNSNATRKVKTRKNSAKTIELSSLESIRLVILLKDGTKIEKAMSEVIKFSVDKGILTVIATDGSIKRYSILDVAKLTVE